MSQSSKGSMWLFHPPGGASPFPVLRGDWPGDFLPGSTEHPAQETPPCPLACGCQGDTSLPSDPCLPKASQDKWPLRRAQTGHVLLVMAQLPSFPLAPHQPRDP